jgi:hypothetical protein
MAPLERIAPNLRAVLAPHVPLQFVDGRHLRPAHDIQRHRLVRVAAEAADLEIEVSGIESIAQSGRWLGRSLETEHALVLGETVGFMPVGPISRCHLRPPHPASPSPY